MTHLPNELALKMDGAQAWYLYVARGKRAQQCGCELPRSRRAWGKWKRVRVIVLETFSSADLGGSSKYSNGNFED
jgi:hypothetical protein